MLIATKLRTLIIILASLILVGCAPRSFNYMYQECERINSTFSNIAKCVEHARINRPYASSDPDRGYFENFVNDLAKKVDSNQMSDYSAKEYVRAKIFELNKQRYENELVRKNIENEENADGEQIIHENVKVIPENFYYENDYKEVELEDSPIS